MLTQRQRPVLYAVIGIVAIWLVAWGGYTFAKHSKVTAEKVAAYLRETELSKLSAEARARALRDLAAKLNALPYEERRAARMDDEWNRWFREMTDKEKSEFLDATLPTGFKQMLTAFEQLPEANRRRAIGDAMRRLKQARDEMATEGGPFRDRGTNRPPELNPELQQKVIQTGLNAFYSQSSAQTKAELAPFLEELQRAMESGRVFRGR
ncbi:MAG: hypothetical protein AB1705_21230 [Verrucomicrobiota bacterium]